MSGDPYSKERQLARGARRYRRKVASPKQWQAIIAAKQGPCRVCTDSASNGGLSSRGPVLIEFHHLIPRSRGGDDVEENIVPVCFACHLLITDGDPWALKWLYASLTTAERTYMVKKGHPL